MQGVSAPRNPPSLRRAVFLPISVMIAVNGIRGIFLHSTPLRFLLFG